MHEPGLQLPARPPHMPGCPAEVRPAGAPAAGEVPDEDWNAKLFFSFIEVARRPCSLAAARLVPPRPRPVELVLLGHLCAGSGERQLHRHFCRLFAAAGRHAGR